jgi:hypothetical protein
MPALSRNEAAEKLATGVEHSKPTTLAEIFNEIFAEKPASVVDPSEIARHIRGGGLQAEELVDLWNVVFPGDTDVWYDEEANTIRYNDELGVL